MKSERKRMIISEIKYWRRNNLLPAHYCDFLITLYSEGEMMDVEADEPAKLSVLQRERKNHNLLMSGLLLAVAGFIAGLFLIKDHPALMLSLTVLLFVGLLSFVAYRTVSKSSVNSFLYILCAFLLLAISFKLWLLLFAGNSIALIGILLLNCILWVFVGMALKAIYFIVAGTLGIIFIVAYVFYQFRI